MHTTTLDFIGNRHWKDEIQSFYLDTHALEVLAPPPPKARAAKNTHEICCHKYWLPHTMQLRKQSASSVHVICSVVHFQKAPLAMKKPHVEVCTYMPACHRHPLQFLWWAAAIVLYMVYDNCCSLIRRPCNNPPSFSLFMHQESNTLCVCVCVSGK